MNLYLYIYGSKAYVGLSYCYQDFVGQWENKLKRGLQVFGMGMAISLITTILCQNRKLYLEYLQ